MDTSILLAQFFGFFFLITGLSMVMKREMMLDIFDKLFSIRIYSYFLGILLLIFGLITVLFHQEWNNNLDIFLSLIGWYFILESLAYLFVSKSLMSGSKKLLREKKFYYIITTPYLLIGFVLVLVSFFQ